MWGDEYAPIVNEGKRAWGEEAEMTGDARSGKPDDWVKALRQGRVGPTDLRLLTIWSGMLIGGVLAGGIFPEVVRSDVIYRPHRMLDFRLTCICAGIMVALVAVGITYLTLYRMNRYLAWISQRDPLTGLYHHGCLTIFLERSIQDRLGTETPLSVMIADIDMFKEVNDGWGHLVGDQVLRYLAGSLRTVVGEKGLVFRMGGEEFAIVLPEMASAEAKSLAEFIRQTASNKEVGLLPAVTVSIGVASVSPDVRSATDLIKRADDAMYEAKHRGRNQVVEWSEISS